MLKKGKPQGFATAIPATFATVDSENMPKVARVAKVAVANLQKPPANDPGSVVTVAKVATVAVANDPRANPDSGSGTVRPPGLTPALMAASIALDAQIHAAGLLPGNADWHCWPDSTAWTGAEIDTFTARLARFSTKGVTHTEAEALADRLVQRDRGSDDRALCLECTHLAGYGASSWRCGNWERSGIAITPRSTQLAADLVFKLQRCTGLTFNTPMKVST